MEPEKVSETQMLNLRIRADLFDEINTRILGTPIKLSDWINQAIVDRLERERPQGRSK